MVLVGAGLLTGCGGGGDGGAESPQAAVDAYVRALNARDAPALEALAPPGNNAADEVRRRIDDFGGKEISLGDVDISSDISPDVANAQLTGSGGYAERLTLTRKDGRWYVVLGRRSRILRNRPRARIPGKR
ncbi:Cif family virulence factor [Amycolatopsis lurida]|uniref:hypothetical protein n=1 Tax=Amycolatopsis lurida TaxID=31959 RepID=UPI003664D7D3